MKSKNHKEGIFISHINEESQVARSTTSLLKSAFGSDLKVFVSSDYDSLRGGDKWFATILENIKSSEVVLVLISKESYQRPWIPYEAGVCEGAGGKVIPVVHRNTAVRDLPPPLSEYTMRNLQDVNSVLALLSDIGQAIERAPLKVVEAESFVQEVERLEKESPIVPGVGVTRAWVDTIITPLLRKLRNEQESLANQKWKWDRVQNRLNPINDVRTYLLVESRPDLMSYGYIPDVGGDVDDRLEQFERYYPDIHHAIEEHDDRVKRLQEDCSGLNQTLKNSLHLRKVYERTTTPECLAKIETTLSETFGTDSIESHLGILAEHMVNQIDELPSNYGTSKFWNRYKKEYLSVLTESSINQHHHKLMSSVETLSKRTEQLVGLLKGVREDLSIKHDLPY